MLVRLPVDLNHDTAEPLRRTVIDHWPDRDDAALVLDFASTTLITSIGIAAILQVEEFCKDRAAPMAMAAVSPSIASFLKMLRLDRRFTQEPTAEAAIDRFSQESLN